MRVTPGLFRLIEQARELSQATQGAFDITGVVFRDLYNFKGESFTFPDSQSIKNRINLVGYQHIELQKPNLVKLAKQGMRIGFGAIGKGYAAESVKQKIKARGVRSGAINASGATSIPKNIALFFLINAGVERANLLEV